MRPASAEQGRSVIAMLRALVEHYADRPHLLPTVDDLPVSDAGSEQALRNAVTYVGGMTDRFACRQAITLLGFRSDALPQGIDTFS